jgi:hypothetical protein
MTKEDKKAIKGLVTAMDAIYKLAVGPVLDRPIFKSYKHKDSISLGLVFVDMGRSLYKELERERLVEEKEILQTLCKEMVTAKVLSKFHWEQLVISIKAKCK